MNIENKRTALVVISTLLWLITCVLGWNGLFLQAIWLGIIIIGIYFVLGVAKKQIVSTKFFCYPILTWGILWAVSFWAAKYFADVFAGIQPSFTILGMHPSFAMVVFGYWFGGVLTISLGFLLFKNEWLSEKDWETFKEKAELLKSTGEENA